MAAPAEDFDAWLAALTRPSVLIEMAVLAACIGLAWLMVRLARASLDPQRRPNSVRFGARIVDGVLFPVAALLCALAARWALQASLPVALLHIAVPILASLVVIRIAVLFPIRQTSGF